VVLGTQQEKSVTKDETTLSLDCETTLSCSLRSRQAC